MILDKISFTLSLAFFKTGVPDFVQLTCQEIRLAALDDEHQFHNMRGIVHISPSCRLAVVTVTADLSITPQHGRSQLSISC